MIATQHRFTPIDPGEDFDASKDESYGVYVVKWNRGTEVRLAQLNSLLRYHFTGEDNRFEVQLNADHDTDFKTELWQKGQIIWFSPIYLRIWEATCLDDKAKEETVLVQDLIEKVPDVVIGGVGTLFTIGMEKGERVFDGQNRMILKEVVRRI